MKKNSNKCWCGKSFLTPKGLTLHKSKKDHYKTDAQKEADAEDFRKRFEAIKKTRYAYIEEVSENLSNGRHLQIGDKIKIERLGVIKEIITTGENQTVEVKVDIISRTYGKQV